MIMNITDMCFITLFITIVSVFIGLSVVNVIDKKISNVSVNIPKQNVVLSVNRLDGDKLSVCACSTDNKDNTDNKDKSKSNLKQIEAFTVSDAQDINKYNENIAFIKSTVSDEDLILEKSWINAQDFGDSLSNNVNDVREAPAQYVSCANASIAEQYKTGEKSLLPYQIACGYPNKLTAENYYKTFYKKHVVPIEDYRVKGYNYQDFNTYPTPYQTRQMRILSPNTKGLPASQTRSKNMPVGYNYAFLNHNLPAMPMP